MANTNGVNQFDRFSREPVHGDVSRARSLMRSAPMSGAPLAGSALNTPARSQDLAVRSGRAPGGTGAAGAVMAPAPAPMPEQGDDIDLADRRRIAEAWTQIAERPGASKLVREIAEQARAEAGM